MSLPLSPFLILICSGHSQSNKKKCEAYCVRLWIPPRKYFGPFPYLRFYCLIFLTRHFTVEIILYSATWGLNVTCFTFRYFKPRKESCHCIPSTYLFFSVLFLSLFHWQEGKAFLPTYFTLQYRLSNHYMVHG